jgi:hypothetical protein
MKSLFLCALAALAAAPVIGQHSVSLQEKTFSPTELTVKDGETISICNRDPFIHLPFSYSKYNKFGSPKGVKLKPGDCLTHTARNPTSAAIELKIFDELHAGEKLTVKVLPAGDRGVSGAWRITQTGNGSTYTGTLRFTQSGSQLGGSAEWDNHNRGSISGSFDGSKIIFTVTYGEGLVGFYEATVDLAGGRMTNGSARSNKGGAAVSWIAALQ